ncbi:hypothetical protein FA09DRAFT_339395 [Tilletiopsis washingtonensis]|uniref:Uncharacterized protein n=1 Tax=Tilletiopsis washingtonensis TaxID=58919 RepID=A0A316Z8X2_9BASI|nr:hypothetical protein FA09DRAFT_339395 [Tilletiopsis washingtonensis]PWN97392.1 hypothetical protein FA09DRAFT_339395 [Tilletiopsis washingtonensis]
MSAPPSIVRPGASAAGPPGWEERRAADVEAEHAEEAAKHEAGGGGGEGVFSKLKDGLHKVGEKMALVPEKDQPLQDASTGPEVAS